MTEGKLRPSYIPSLPAPELQTISCAEAMNLFHKGLRPSIFPLAPRDFAFDPSRRFSTPAMQRPRKSVRCSLTSQVLLESRRRSFLWAQPKRRSSSGVHLLLVVCS